MLKYFFSVFFIYCAICVYGQQPNKLRLPKNHTAVYTCAVNENYWVDQSVDSIKAVEKVVTCMQAEIAQDILEKKRNYLQVDYHQKNYTRIDSIFKPKGIKDTASNRGKTPLVKIILQYNRQGEYLGPTLAMLNPEYSLRDFRFFYNTAKQLIYTLNSTSDNPIWTSQHTDTILNTGFELVYTYQRQWQYAGMVDTLGYTCTRINYTSPAQNYYAVNGVMKALGIEMVHSGVAAVEGTMLMEAKTGRIIALYETGAFIGNLDMKTPRENHTWPCEYRYNKSFVLKELVKKPRKKILGIF